jgi:hypothetical protein
MQRIGLGTLQATRKSFARAIREYIQGRTDAATLRTIVYALSHYLAYFRAELDQEVLERVEAMERRIDELPSGNSHHRPISMPKEAMNAQGEN